jgi:Flp pilus assembly protein TadD
MPRTIAALSFFAALMAFAASADAASQRLLNACGGGDDLDASIKACTQIIEGKETKQNKSAALYNRGWAYRSKGEYDLAIADQTSAIELDPKSYRALMDRSLSYYQKREYDLCIADATRAIELKPKLSEAYNNRGSAYREKGDYDRGVADLSHAIELDRKNSTAFHNRGSIYNQKGDYEHAIADLTRSIELDPKKSDAYRYRAIAYLKTGKFELARADLAKALELKPDYPEAKATLAELEQAEASAKEAIAPSSPASAQSTTEPAAPTVETAAASPLGAASPPAAVPLGKRVALVIGNAAYTHTQALANPRNDAADMAAVLERLGFTVIFEHDLDKRGMDDTFRRFAREVKGADAALFYYAGHAMQFEGVNYLMPVDAKLADEADVPYEMAKLDDVVADMARMSGVASPCSTPAATIRWKSSSSARSPRHAA